MVMATSQQHRPKVLLVEDHALLARLTAEMIQEAGCDVVGPVRSVRDALRIAANDRPDVALVDLRLPDGTGEELTGALRKMGVACAIHTGFDRPSSPPPAIADLPWLVKPADPEELSKIIANASVRVE
jgi:DNA-binding NarL/FixJ family response regulator